MPYIISYFRPILKYLFSPILKFSFQICRAHRPQASMVSFMLDQKSSTPPAPREASGGVSRSLLLGSELIHPRQICPHRSLCSLCSTRLNKYNPHPPQKNTTRKNPTAHIRVDPCDPWLIKTALFTFSKKGGFRPRENTLFGGAKIPFLSAADLVPHTLLL